MGGGVKTVLFVLQATKYVDNWLSYVFHFGGTIRLVDEELPLQQSAQSRLDYECRQESGRVIAECAFYVRLRALCAVFWTHCARWRSGEASEPVWQPLEGGREEVTKPPQKYNRHRAVG